jgi:glycosyltransferase involved in cell wall biosynthesis
MRLLLAIPYYAPAYAFGGSVTVAETVVGGLLAAGHEVTVATTDVLDERTRIPLDAPAIPAGAEVVRLRNVSHRLAATNGYAPRGLRRWLAFDVRRFDVVLLHDFYSAVSVMSARAAERAGVPYVLQPLGTAGAGAERGRSAVKRAFVRLWGARTLDAAAAILHITEHERADLLGVGAPADRLVRMPLPLDLPEPSDAPRAEVPTVASVGRLHPIKRIDRLIEAVALARETVPDLRLEVAGPGERHQRELEAVAARCGVAGAVRFHGFVSAGDKQALLRRAHAFALLSQAEGLPMAALEAMASGTPVVLSEGCHFPEVHERGGLVTDGSPAATAAALAALLTDPARHAALTEGARTAAAEFRREAVMPRMIALLEELSARRPAAARGRAPGRPPAAPAR